MLGDSTSPLRCSKLAALVKCSMRIHLLSLNDNEDDEGGTPAQTGSLTHAGVAEFHKTQGKTLDFRRKAAWDAIAANRAKFPLADGDEVRLFITPYMEDPRNIHAECVAVEERVDFTLPPHPCDESKQLIYVQGTYDQIRMSNNVPIVYDLKTGKKTGVEMLADYAVQLAAYAYGAAQQERFKGVTKAYVIRNYSYRARSAVMPSPQGVFWSAPFDSREQIELILENVRMHVGLYRNGEINFGPGPHCTYCEFGGLVGCLQEYQSKHLKA